MSPVILDERPTRAHSGRTAMPHGRHSAAPDRGDMTATMAMGSAGATVPQGSPVLDVVIPVHDEELDLEPCVRKLHAHLSATFPYDFRITIADNASTDATFDIATALAAELDAVTAVHLTQKGRGRALRATWSGSDAAVLAYMDVDLSTDLAALLPLVAPLITGHSDVAIGTRLARGSRVTRGVKREMLSRGYNLLLRGALAARFSDAQCGFKAIRRDVAHRLLPLVHDTGWFFDTELLVLAQRAGLRIHEVPVDWVDDPDSRVDIVATVLADLHGIARLSRDLATGRLPIGQLRDRLGRTPPGLTGQLVRFAGVGIMSTLAYLALFLVLRGGAAGAQVSNLVALAVTAVGNTAANRRLTFGVTGRRHAARHQVQGLLVFALGLGLTSGALVGLHAVTATPTRPVELAVLVAANLTATLSRFLLLRRWVFAPTGPATDAAGHPPPASRIRDDVRTPRKRPPGCETPKRRASVPGQVRADRVGVAVVEVGEDGEGALPVPPGEVRAAGAEQAVGETVERAGLLVPLPGLGGQGESALVVVDGGVVPVGELVGLPGPVAQLALDAALGHRPDHGQGLLVAVEGRGELAEPGVRHAHVGQDRALVPLRPAPPVPVQRLAEAH